MGYFSRLQTEILELAACGLGADQIADKLHLAEDEVEAILAEDHDGDAL